MDKKQQSSRCAEDAARSSKGKSTNGNDPRSDSTSQPGPSEDKKSHRVRSLDRGLEKKKPKTPQKKDFSEVPSDFEDIEDDGSGKDYDATKDNDSEDSEEYEEKKSPRASKKRKRSAELVTTNTPAKKDPTTEVSSPPKKIKKEPKVKLFRGEPVIRNASKPRYLNGVKIDIPQRIKYWPESNDYADEPEEEFLWCRYCPTRITKYGNWNQHLKQHLSFVLEWIFRVWNPIFRNAYGSMRVEVSRNQVRNVNDGFRCPLQKIRRGHGKNHCPKFWQTWNNDNIHRHLIFDHGILNRILTDKMLIPRTIETTPISLNFEFKPGYFGPPPVKSGNTWMLKNTTLIDSKTGAPFKGATVNLEIYCKLIGQAFNNPEAAESNVNWNRLLERWNEQEETHGLARINLTTGVPATPYHHGRQDENGNMLPLKIHDRTMIEELEVATESQKNGVVQGQFKCCQMANEDNQRLNADNLRLHKFAQEKDDYAKKVQDNSAKNAKNFNNSVEDLRKKIESLQDQLNRSKESEANLKEQFNLLKCGRCNRQLRCGCQDTERRTEESVTVDTDFDNDIGTLTEDGLLFNDPSLLINYCKNCKRNDGMIDGDMCHLCKVQIPTKAQETPITEQDEGDGSTQQVQGGGSAPTAPEYQVPEAIPSTSTGAMGPHPVNQHEVMERPLREDDYVLATGNIARGLFGTTFDRLQQVEFEDFPNPFSEEQFRNRLIIINKLANATINELNDGNSRESKRYLAQLVTTNHANVVLLMADQLQKMMKRIKANETKLNETIETQQTEITRVSSMERQLDTLPNVENLVLLEEEIKKLQNIIREEKLSLNNSLVLRRQELETALEKIRKDKEELVTQINESLKIVRKDAAEKERKLTALNASADKASTNLKAETSKAEKAATRAEAAATASTSSDKILEKSINTASKLSKSLNDAYAKGDSEARSRIEGYKTQIDGLRKEVKKLEDTFNDCKTEARKAKAVSEKLAGDNENNERRIREIDRQARHMDRYGDMYDYDYGEEKERRPIEDLRKKCSQPNTGEGRHSSERSRHSPERSRHSSGPSRPSPVRSRHRSDSPRRSSSRRSRSRSEDLSPKKKKKAKHTSPKDKRGLKVHAPTNVKTIVDRKDIKTETEIPKTKKDSKKSAKSTKEHIKSKKDKKGVSELRDDEYPKDDSSDLEHQGVTKYENVEVQFGSGAKGGRTVVTHQMSSSSESSDDDNR